MGKNAPPEIDFEELLSEADDDGGGSGGGAISVRWLYWKALQWLLIALGVQTLAGLMPRVVESVYSRTIYYYLTRLLSRLNGFFSVSLAEAFFGLLVAWFVVWTLWNLRLVYIGDRRSFDLVKVLFLHLVWTGSILFVLFKLMWGFNYQRMPLAEAAALEQRLARSDELETIGSRIISGLRNNHAAMAMRTGSPINPGEISRAVELSFNNNHLIGPAAAGGFSQPKPLYASSLASLLGVRSFYLPFTGEVSYNARLEMVELPFAIARAKAYQRGYAREDEAGFVAYLVCIASPDPLVRYSGYLHGARILDYLDRSRIGRFSEMISEEPRADLQRIRSSGNSLTASYLGRVTNMIFDVHLRVNQVVNGLGSIDDDIPLIIDYYLSPVSGSDPEK